VSRVGCRKSTTIGELTSGKSSDSQARKSSAIGIIIGSGAEVMVWNTDGQGKSGRG
jgi:hypothetical protein